MKQVLRIKVKTIHTVFGCINEKRSFLSICPALFRHSLKESCFSVCQLPNVVSIIHERPPPPANFSFQPRASFTHLHTAVRLSGCSGSEEHSRKLMLLCFIGAHWTNNFSVMTKCEAVFYIWSFVLLKVQSRSAEKSVDGFWVEKLLPSTTCVFHSQ